MSGSLKIQDAKNRHFGTIAQLCLAVSSQLRRVSTIEKNLLNTDTFSTCPCNMVDFGLLMAGNFWRVWDNPADFNRFRILAALLHGTPVVGVSQTAALNRGHHLYSAGRPSRWALAHILVPYSFAFHCSFITRSPSHASTDISCCRVSVCLSQVGVLLKWLNVGLHKQRHTIAQGL